MNKFDAIIAEEDNANVGAGTKKSRTRKTATAKPTPKEPPKSFEDKLRDGDYRTKVEYPDRPKASFFANPEVAAAYRAAIRAHNEDQGRLNDQFKTDLLAAHGVTNNPKADTCFGLAWSHGHHAGWGEVANYFSEFVELIK